MLWSNKEIQPLPTREASLPGRDTPLLPTAPHYVSGISLIPPYPAHMRSVTVGMGCFWGAERCFWQLPGVWVTAVGYAGGFTPNPTYREVCSGLTGHAEVVRVVYDPEKIGLRELLRCFWENHNPTQGMRQGNDVGTQYRSIILAENNETLQIARSSRIIFQNALKSVGQGDVTTEITFSQTFYFAEEYHQQYLAKNPNGYCGLGGIGIECPSLEC
ncbi:peptide-methionine (S)-S-oxide reductase MsrA [Acidihalobacter prosperus]